MHDESSAKDRVQIQTVFQIGDHIRILDKDMPIEATVEDIFTFYTHLRTTDGGLRIFPNSLLLQKAITVVNNEDKDMPIEATVEDIFTFYTHLRTTDVS